MVLIHHKHEYAALNLIQPDMLRTYAWLRTRTFLGTRTDTDILMFTNIYMLS